jgi:hypothetical protein
MASSKRRVPHGDHIGGEFGNLEADLHVALRAEVVDLIGTQS